MKSKLTIKDLSHIIKICGESGVSEFQLGDIHLSFAKIKEIKDSAKPDPLDQVEKINPKVEISEEFVTLDEVAEKEEKLANFLLENPKEYEEALLREDLIDLEDELDDKEA